jgi:hypothetical protein
MHSPAEEVGLLGQRLATRVQNALDGIPRPELVELLREIHRTATDRHLAYQHDGVTETITLLPCPLTMRQDQLGYTHYVSQIVLNAIKRLPDLYFEVPEVREILRVTDVEEEWLRECWTPAHRETNPVFGRFDAVVDYTSAVWKDTIKFMEPNLIGVGGLHIAPTAISVLADLAVPALLHQDSGLRLQLPIDIRDLLLQDLLEHLETVGRPGGQIVLVDPKFAAEGPDEPDSLARWYREQRGIDVLHADPSELRQRGDEVYYGDARVDVVYRDGSVLDLMGYLQEGVDVTPMRTLLRQNRVVSSISAELDQKSIFELFTDPALAERLFTVEERQVMRRHVLWTRLLAPRFTTSPTGERIDLPEYARRQRESLVLKPNRSYGGDGVVVGHTVEQSAWESALDRALGDTEARYVLQHAAPIPVQSFHVFDSVGQVEVEPFYVVMGLAPSRYGVALMARASQQQVVNVAQHGGICAVMVGATSLRKSELGMKFDAAAIQRAATT